MPFDDDAFDVVVSQFGHMFAPRPEVAVREMLRVLRPGGTLAFSTWPPELFTGKIFALVFVMVWFRATFPRLREDQLQRMSWLIFIPLGLLNIIRDGQSRILAFEREGE